MHVRTHCFKNEFSELTGASSPQTSPGLIVLESMVEGSLSTVIPRTSSKYDTPVPMAFIHCP